MDMLCHITPPPPPPHTHTHVGSYLALCLVLLACNRTYPRKRTCDVCFPHDFLNTCAFLCTYWGQMIDCLWQCTSQELYIDEFSCLPPRSLVLASWKPEHRWWIVQGCPEKSELLCAAEIKHVVLMCTQFVDTQYGAWNAWNPWNFDVFWVVSNATAFLISTSISTIFEAISGT